MFAITMYHCDDNKITWQALP